MRKNQAVRETCGLFNRLKRLFVKLKVCIAKTGSVKLTEFANVADECARVREKGLPGSPIWTT